MKKILSMLLVMCFLLTTLLACGGGEEPTETPTGAASDSGTGSGAASVDNGGTLASTNQYGKNDLDSVLPVDELDFDGENINLVIRNHERYIREWGKLTTAEDDILDVAIKERDKQVAEDLNIVIVPHYLSGQDAGKCRDDFAKLVKEDVDLNIHAYDIVANFGYYCSDVTIREYSANLLDTDTFPYFNFALPCWNQSIIQNANINGKMLAAGGDLTLSIFDFAMVMWMNNDLYDELKSDDDPENIQDLVLEGIGQQGGWTAAHLYNWSNVYENSSTDDCDTYGVHLQGKSWCTQPTDNLPFCWDLELMITNPDGTHSYNVVGNQKAEDAIALFRDMYDGVGNSFEHIYNGNCNAGCFTAGNIVFKGDVIFWDEAGNLALRDMEDDYALIPWPKWDETQTDYYCSSQDCYTLLTVIDHYESTIPTKGEAISAYMQYTCELSYEDVRLMYFYKIVEPKFFGLDDSTGSVTKSQTIFRTIIDNLQFDYWALYSSSLGHIMHMFRYCVANSTDTLENTYNQQKATYDKNLRNTDIWFGLIEGEIEE